MAADGEVLFYDATPRLEVEGTENAMAASLLETMEMSESEGGMTSIELAFTASADIAGVGNDLPFENGTNEDFTLGKTLRVVTGAQQDPQEVFQGQITGIELVLEESGPPRMIVLAEDGLRMACLKRRTKLYQDMSLGEVVEAIAQEHGLQVVAADLDFAFGNEMQANETDLGFLRRICARFDVDLQIVGEELHISPRALVDRGTRSLAYGETLISFRGLADISEQISQVTLSGWDHDSAQSFNVTSGTALQLGEGGGRTGDAVLAAEFSERSEHIAEIAVSNQEEAQTVADALHSRRARRFVSVEGKVTGDPALRVGTVVEIAGVGPRFENSYYVTHAQHRFTKSSGGYLTSFRAESAYWGG